jgi:hypothetical protein
MEELANAALKQVEDANSRLKKKKKNEHLVELGVR